MRLLTSGGILTTFKLYKNKQNPEEIVEAEFQNDEIGGCWIIQRDINPFMSDKDFKENFEEVSNAK